MNDETLVPLWRQLQAAASVLSSVRGGVSATAALAAVPADLRPATQALAYQALRWLGRAEALRRQLARRAPAPAVDALLCTALALVWREVDAPYEPFTLVNQAVEAAKRQPETRNQSAFVNACLRRFLRERDALVAATDDEPVAHWNHPRWWIERLKRDHPRDWEDILEANNRQAPMTLRVNTRRTSVADYRARLAAAGIDSTPAGPQGLTLAQALPVQRIPGFADGFASVQDAAAQRAAPLLLEGLARPVGRRPRVLDACAAPGGKTAHLLELADLDVMAIDIDAGRAERIGQTLERLQLTAEVRAADAARPAEWWDGLPFDGILLDAPCTASGIVRRHPDVRWLRRESDIAQLSIIQANLLQVLWPLLAPGGRLVYCTCSVFRAEGDEPIQAFVAHNTDAVIRPSPGHLKPRSAANGQGVRDNPEGDHDGFFYAVLEKRPA